MFTNMDDLKIVCPDSDEGPVERAMKICLSSDSKDPIKLLKILMKDHAIPFHGPVHHCLVPFAVLTAFKNSGGDIDLAASLKKAQNRGSIIPAAVCGHWGSCGAALGCGISFSIITGSGPLSTTLWNQGQVLVIKCLTNITKYGGPRCCKRNAYLAIPMAVEYFKEHLGVQMEIPEKITCYVSENNSVCLKEVCPFNPDYKG